MAQAEAGTSNNSRRGRLHAGLVRNLNSLRAGAYSAIDATWSSARGPESGLEAATQPAPVEMPSPAGTARELKQAGRRSRRVAGLARLAEAAPGGVHLPRALPEPEELPMGGVTDMANRGPLDRLLLSELAHDD